MTLILNFGKRPVHNFSSIIWGGGEWAQSFLHFSCTKYQVYGTKFVIIQSPGENNPVLCGPSLHPASVQYIKTAFVSSSGRESARGKTLVYSNGFAFLFVFFSCSRPSDRSPRRPTTTRPLSLSGFCRDFLFPCFSPCSFRPSATHKSHSYPAAVAPHINFHLIMIYDIELNIRST